MTTKAVEFEAWVHESRTLGICCFSKHDLFDKEEHAWVMMSDIDRFHGCRPVKVKVTVQPIEGEVVEP